MLKFFKSGKNPANPVDPAKSGQIRLTFFGLKSGPVPIKMIPIRSGSGSVRIFDPVHTGLNTGVYVLPK